MKYSFIIPVYNGEKYLKECFDSVLSQTINDFEVIIVDDGSTDSSGKICDGYAEKYPNVNVFHNKNGGVSAARNFGMEKATGEYISFVDCDDIISPYMLEYAEKAENDFDIIVFKHTRQSRDELCGFFEQGHLLEADKQTAMDKTVYDSERGSNYLYNAVSKLYRADILSGVRFVEGITIGEDKIFGFCAFGKASSVYYCDQKMYYCRPNLGSVTHKYACGYMEIADKTFEVYREIIGSIKDNAHYRELLTLRAVVVMKNIVIFELCHKDNPKSYRRRKSEWDNKVKNSLTWKFFSECSGNGLNGFDRFFLYAYKHSFFRINLMTKCKPVKAFEYAVYKIFKR